MQAVTDIADARARREEERRERRAAAARRRYHEDPERSRERCRTSKQAQRSGETTPRYDVEDYADEWMFLTRMGLRAGEIIARSRPSHRWFIEHIMPAVTIAVCSSCLDVFNPQVTRTLTRCSTACGIRPE